jgi:dihydroceramidase
MTRTTSFSRGLDRRALNRSAQTRLVVCSPSPMPQLYVSSVDSTLGFWGPPTSSVDWCEANYAHSHYVCELFNTVSSVAMVVVGILGAVLHRRLLERRFTLAFLSVALVGVGSMAFHGTLLVELQMLDELPMLYTATLLVYTLIEDQPRPRFGLPLKAALLVYLALATYGAAFTRGQLQFWFFQITFAGLEFYALYRTYRLHRASDSAALRRLYRGGMCLYVAAILVWFIDLNFCTSLVAGFAKLGLPNLELHAWWHILVSAGFYALILVIGHERMRTLGTTPRLVTRGCMPRLAR